MLLEDQNTERKSLRKVWVKVLTEMGWRESAYLLPTVPGAIC